MRKFKCADCGFVYEPEKGLPENGIPPGAPFEVLPPDFCSFGERIHPTSDRRTFHIDDIPALSSPLTSTDSATPRWPRTMALGDAFPCNGRFRLGDSVDECLPGVSQVRLPVLDV
jgi:rubredoxin